MTMTWEVPLARIPGERIEPEDFAVREVATPVQPAAGEVLVRADVLGLNAGLRHRLGTGRSTTLGPAIGLGDVPRSDAVGTVVASSDASLPVGSSVVGLLPWAGLSSVPAAELRAADPDVSPLEQLTIRGHVGLTAYVALACVGALAKGETVWISAAAGGVGSCAVQMARALGARVLGSAGGEERVGFLRDGLGVEHALDRTRDLAAQLDEAAPEGLDVYVDMVGGDHLELALARMRERGRVVLVGRSAAALRDTLTLDHAQMIRRRLRVAGMSVTDHPEARSAMLDLVAGADPGMKPVGSVRHGPETIARSFAGLFRGGLLGRAIVDLRNEATGGAITCDEETSQLTPWGD